MSNGATRIEPPVTPTETASGPTVPISSLSRDGFALMSKAPSGPVWVFQQATLRYLAVNAACTDFFGYTREEFSAMRISDILTQPSLDIAKTALPAPHASKVRTMCAPNRLKDGRMVMVTTRSIAVLFEGVPARLCTVEPSYGPRPEASGSPPAESGWLSQEVDRLKTNLEDRDLFLAQAAHEFRTPLTSILLLTESVPEASSADAALEAARRRLSEIRQCGETLLRQFDRIIQIARIGAGRLTAEMGRFKVGPLIQSAVEAVAAAARHKGVGIQVAVSRDVDEIWADDFMIHQILLNLLANAVEFTPAGQEVTVEVTLCPSGNASVHIVDQGPGISPGDLGRLFIPYAQVGTTGRRPKRGSGLGLALVKQFADAQGITLSVTSTVDVGSRFLLLLPSVPEAVVGPDPAPVTSSPGGVAPTAAAEGMTTMPTRVLVVDDNDMNRGLLGDYLVNAGFDVHVASDGPTALSRLPLLRPDVVVMDVQMPHMDGMEATRRIRKMTDNVLASTPVLGLTALSMVADRERCIAAGMTDYRSKPFSLRALATLLREMSPRTRGADRTAPSAPHRPHSAPAADAHPGRLLPGPSAVAP
jgi:signal transduction histidine kinase/DNA-binding NarL/FixJ family response regulator